MSEEDYKPKKCEKIFSDEEDFDGNYTDSGTSEDYDEDDEDDGYSEEDCGHLDLKARKGTHTK
jgi:hypothetical protein